MSDTRGGGPAAKTHTERETKECFICANPIPVEAKKCTKCGSWQPG